MKWYNEGEKSTKYFLNQLKSRSKKQKITSLIENNQKEQTGKINFNSSHSTSTEINKIND